VRALILAVTATLSTLTPALALSPASGLTADEPHADAYEQQAVDTTNDERVDHDMAALRPDACLSGLADRQAARMARQGRLFHQDLGAVLRSCGLSSAGENVAEGYRNGRALVSRGWMRSPGHRANILTRPFRVVAVGAAQSGTGRWYVAELLAR
jgi:uncharacterized protein YkwD